MEVFMGTIQPFGFNFAPKNWASCAGQIMAIQQNSALFSLLGVNYGGNGQTNFGLPDLRGRSMLNQGQGPGLQPYTIGEQAGTESTTLLITEMPAHTHSMSVTSAAATTPTPATNVMLAAADGSDSGGNAVTVNVYAPPGALIPLAPQALAPAGGNQPFSILQPFLVLNVCIALQGIYPSRN